MIIENLSILDLALSGVKELVETSYILKSSCFTTLSITAIGEIITFGTTGMVQTEGGEGF